MLSASSTVVLVAGQEPAHCVAPARLAGQPDGRAAEGVDAALDLELGEAHVAARHANVCGEQQLDAERHAPALGGGDHGGRPGLAVVAPGVAGVLGVAEVAFGSVRPTAKHVRTLSVGAPDNSRIRSADLGEVQAAGSRQGHRVGAGDRPLPTRGSGHRHRAGPRR